MLLKVTLLNNKKASKRKTFAKNVSLIKNKSQQLLRYNVRVKPDSIPKM